MSFIHYIELSKSIIGIFYLKKTPNLTQKKTIIGFFFLFLFLKNIEYDFEFHVKVSFILGKARWGLHKAEPKGSVGNSLS